MKIGIWVLIIGLLAGAFYLGVFDTASIQGYSSKYYSKVGDSVILDTRGDAKPLEYTDGFSTGSVTTEMKTWIEEWEYQGKVLSPKCQVSSVIVYKYTGQQTFLNIEGKAEYSSSGLVCITGKPYQFGLNPSGENWVGAVIRWNFVSPQIAEEEKQEIAEKEKVEEIVDGALIESSDSDEDYVVQCSDNIGCTDICGDDVPTCSNNMCYCDGTKAVVQKGDIGIVTKINMWFDGLFKFLFGWI